MPNTPLQRQPNSAPKRKAVFETPSVPKVNKSENMSSPSDARANFTNGLYVASAFLQNDG